MAVSSRDHEQSDDKAVILPARPNPATSDGNGHIAGVEMADTLIADENGVATTAPDPAVAALLEAPKDSLFRNRRFMSLWIAQAMSQTAQNTLNLSLVEYVGHLTKSSPTQTAIETVSFVLPGVLFSALAGVFVDRLNKRTILVATNLLRALIIPLLFFMDESSPGFVVPLIFLITFVFSTISQFFAPAESSMIPLLVPPEQLTKANSLFQLTYFAATFIGFSILAPILPTVIGPKNLFISLSILYVICTLLVWTLPNNIEKVETDQGDNTRQLLNSIWSDLREGLAFIWHDKLVRLAIVYLTTVQAVLFMLSSIGIPYVGSKGLGLPETAIIFILAPLSIGLGIGVVLINRFVNVRNRERYSLIATVAMGINIIGIGMVKVIAEAWVAIFSPGIPIGGWGLIGLMVTLSLTFGFEMAVLQIPALTVLQERSPKAIIGRVYAAYFTFSNLATILPILGVGALGDLFGLVPVFFLMGLCVLGIAYYAYRQQPT